MQDIAAPPISDLVLTGTTTVEDQLVGENVGTLTTSGSNTGHGVITWTLTSTTLTGDKFRIGTGADADKLEVGPNAIGPDDGGSYSVVIKGTDELLGSREETFSITITDNDITVVEFDNNTTAANVKYGDDADILIDILQATGGVGSITFSITDYDTLGSNDMTNIRIDGTSLEIGPSIMDTVVGAHTIEVTATDSNPWPLSAPLVQTRAQNFVITVLSTAITNVTLSANEIYNNSVNNDAIGTLTAVVSNGGQGPWTFAFGADPSSKLNNVRIDGAVLEVDTSGIDQGPGSYNVNIIATDSIGQVSSTITIAITILSSFTNLKALDLNATGIDPDFQSNYLQETTGLFDTHLTATTPFSLNTWFKTNTDPATTHVSAAYENTKYFKMTGHNSATNYSWLYYRGGYLYPTGLATVTNRDTDKHKMQTTVGDEGFTVSWWGRFNTSFSSDPAATTHATNGFNMNDGGGESNNAIVSWNKDWQQRATIHCNLSGEMELFFEGGNANYVHIPLEDMTGYRDDTWRHFVFTYNGTWTTNAQNSFTLYVNGVSTKGAGYSMTGTTTWNQFADATSIIMAGAYDTDGWSHWNLEFDQDDVTEMYNSGKVLPATEHSKFSSTNCWLCFSGEDALDSISNLVSSGWAEDVDCIQDQSGNNNHLTAAGVYDYQPWLVDHDVSSSLYVAADVTESNTTTAAPVIFRNGGKVEAIAAEGYINFENTLGGSYLNANYSKANIKSAGTSTYTNGPTYEMNTAGWTQQIRFKSLDTTYPATLLYNYIYKTDVHTNGDHYWKLEQDGSTATNTNLIIYYDFNTSGTLTLTYNITAYMDQALHTVVHMFKGSVDYASNGTDAFELYIDNTLVTPTSAVDSTGSLTGTFRHSGQTLYYGGYSVGTAEYELHDACHINIALTSAQRTSLYNSNAIIDINTWQSSESLANDKIAYWLKCGDGANDAIDATTYGATYSSGVNSMDDYGPNGNDWFPYFLTSGGQIYSGSYFSIVEVAAVPAKIGDGITISLTDKYSDAGAYVAAGSEDPKIVVSFDGFENAATKVLIYDSDVTDNAWKNLVVIYDSSLTDNHSRISLYLNGIELTPLGSPSVTFTGNNNYFKNVSDTASNTTIGATGIVETSGANGVHTLQAAVDSISLHSEALSSSMVTELYNSGVPVNILDSALVSDHTKVEMWVNFEDVADNATTAQDETSNNKDITLVNMETGDYLTLSGSDSIYYNP
jgi:hypothetical protein